MSFEGYFGDDFVNKVTLKNGAVLYMYVSHRASFSLGHYRHISYPVFARSKNRLIKKLRRMMETKDPNVPYHANGGNLLGLVKPMSWNRSVSYRKTSGVFLSFCDVYEHELPKEMIETRNNLLNSVMFGTNIVNVRLQIQKHLEVKTLDVKEIDFSFIKENISELGIPQCPLILKDDVLKVRIDPLKMAGYLNRVRFKSYVVKGSPHKDPLVQRTKGEAINTNLAYYYEIMRRLNRGIHIDPFCVYLLQGREKDNETDGIMELIFEPKTRLVQVPDVPYDLLGNIVLMHIKERWYMDNSPIHPKKSTLGSTMYEVMRDDENYILIEGDWKAFDATASVEVIKQAFKILRLHFPEGKKMDAYFDVLYKSFCYKNIVADGGAIIRLSGTIPSGHSLTSMIGSIVNWIYLKDLVVNCPYIDYKDSEKKPTLIWVQGDDWKLKFPKLTYINYDLATKWIENRYGIKSKFSIQEMFTNDEGFQASTFLRVIMIDGDLSVSLSHTAERLAGVRHKEKETGITKQIQNSFKYPWNAILDNPPKPGTKAFHWSVKYLCFLAFVDDTLNKANIPLRGFDRHENDNFEKGCFLIRNYLKSDYPKKYSKFSELLASSYNDRKGYSYDFSSDKIDIQSIYDINIVNNIRKRIRDGTIPCVLW